MKNRHHTAIELVGRISRGPIPSGLTFTPDQVREIEAAHRRWYETWIEADLQRLLAGDLKTTRAAA